MSALPNRRGVLDAVIAAAAGRSVEQIDPVLLDLLRLGAYQLLRTNVHVHQQDRAQRGGQGQRHRVKRTQNVQRAPARGPLGRGLCRCRCLVSAHAGDFFVVIEHTPGGWKHTPDAGCAEVVI